ncbi:hypothetical protein OM226_11655 [Escherichia albertii]|nr:hypothetical protein [Escherichia albertii]MCZ8848549.1 hypothetical protein [Escherichia albertii]
MIRERIQQAINERLVSDSPFNVVPESASPAFDGQIPTLKNGVWQKASPMLQARFAHCGCWLSATHGSWLSISDMEMLWQEHIENTFLNEIKMNAEASRDNWDNHVWGLFHSNRLSLFAGSDFSYEMVFLLWLDSSVEPEVWVYDCNGESRYKDFDDYLKAYLCDDVSACSRSWRAE